MTTNTISAASVETMKFQVAKMQVGYSLMAIEEAMSHFDYESEAVEGVVFNYLRGELHRKASEGRTFLYA